ncbi:MAG TPA: hypothetical protein VG309_03990 [Rhizomicrobium sp.]|jgi:hypothetical protein|nr:hypothetical protein [Rhizomicrobium sp.]
MRLMAAIVFASVCVASAAHASPSDEIDICVKAAAASDHVKPGDVDRGGCECATKQLHSSLKPGDFALHEQMETIIASGADEKSFNKQLSDIMLARGMNQHDADAFLARSRAAEQKAQDMCNPSPLLTPQALPPPKQ